MAEQFAIAEAKLRAWTSLDEEEMDDESDEEDLPLNDEPITTTLSSGEHECTQDNIQYLGIEPQIKTYE